MRHFLNDIEITPRNRDSIGVVSDFSDNPNELQLNIDSIVLPREAFTIVQQHIQTIGVFQGIPYKVQMEGGISLDYYVDLTDQPIFRSYEVEVKIKKRSGIDNFRDRANGTTFELMLKNGFQFNFIDVPYIIVTPNAVELAVSLTISLYIMTRELIQAIKDLATLTGAFLQATVGVSGSTPGLILNLSVQLVAQITYVALLIVAIVDLAKQMFELIFPPVRKLKSAKLKELLSKGCQYLGYSFQSTLLDNIPGATIVPVPLIKDRKSIFKFLPIDLDISFTKGIPSSSHTVPTLGSLVDAVETMFNARTYVNNGVVRIERRDYLQNLTTNEILPAITIQNDRVDEYTYNLEDVWKRYYIRYTLDYSDVHTLDKIYDIHDAEYSTEFGAPPQIVGINPLTNELFLSPEPNDLVTIKGLNEVNIPFALGSRKEELNWLEIIAKVVFDVIDTLTGAFGGGTNFADQIDARVGVLQISQNFFSTTKFLYCTSGNKQPSNYADFVSAQSLWDNYHYINQIQLNDYEIRQSTRIRLKPSDFVNLLNNNFAQIDGELCEILRIEWIDEKSFAEITYKKPSNWANGNVYTLTIND